MQRPIFWAMDGEYFQANKPIEYKYLSLAVGYNAVRDSALVEVKEITFEPAKNEDGTPIRLRLEASQLVPDTNGNLCLWLVVYHLGEVVSKNIIFK